MVNEHLNNIYLEQELDEKATIQNFLIVQARNLPQQEVNKRTLLYPATIDTIGGGRINWK
jgi:hypothetical protein